MLKFILIIGYLLRNLFLKQKTPIVINGACCYDNFAHSKGIYLFDGSDCVAKIIFSYFCTKTKREVELEKPIIDISLVDGFEDKYDKLAIEDFKSAMRTKFECEDKEANFITIKNGFVLFDYYLYLKDSCGFVLPKMWLKIYSLRLFGALNK